MKKILFLLAVALVMLSCQNNKDYKISGTVADASYEGKNVYLQKVGDNAMENVDTVVVTNGAFSFEGLADTTVLRFVSLDESVEAKNPTRIPVLVEPGTIDVKFDSLITVTGTQVNNSYNDFRAKQAELGKEIRSIVEQYNSAASAGTMTDSLDAEINTAYERIDGEMKSLNFDFIKSNISNELGKYLFMASAAMFEPEQQKEILDLTDETYKSTPNIQRIMTRLENAEKVAVGQPFVDFTMKDPQDKDISLSDYAGKGKIVLIDFWASWCGPCREEMPNVVKAYSKYKNKGFEIVGVSLDKDREKWLQGLKDMNMTWPQMSDLKMWETPVVNLYAFNGIPHTVLLDGEGKIVAKNLRGAELLEKLEELTSK